MNCKQCGAPINVTEGKDFFHCDFCDCYNFTDPNKEGVALVDEISPYGCPTCEKPLVTAVIANIRIYACPICRGNLIDQTKMLPILRLSSSPGKVQEEEPYQPDPSEFQRNLLCPGCRKPMEAYPYGGPGNIIIQGCSHCKHIWLDFGELSKIIRSYSQMYLSSSDEPGKKIQSVQF